MNKKKKIPDFASEQEEALFWQENDSADYMDWGNAKRVTFPNLKYSDVVRQEHRV